MRITGADMKSYLYIAVFLLLAIAAQSDTTVEVRHRIKDTMKHNHCLKQTNGTTADAKIVAHMGPEFTPGAKCLLACVMRHRSMMYDGELPSSWLFLDHYRFLYRGDQKRREKAAKAIELCYDEADAKIVAHMGPEFTPGAKCLLACVMRHRSMMYDGELPSSWLFLDHYRFLYRGDQKRREKAAKAIELCYDEVSKQNIENECELAFVIMDCITRRTYE